VWIEFVSAAQDVVPVTSRAPVHSLPRFNQFSLFILSHSFILKIRSRMLDTNVLLQFSDIWKYSSEKSKRHSTWLGQKKNLI